MNLFGAVLILILGSPVQKLQLNYQVAMGRFVMMTEESSFDGRLMVRILQMEKRIATEWYSDPIERCIRFHMARASTYRHISSKSIDRDGKIMSARAALYHMLKSYECYSATDT